MKNILVSFILVLVFLPLSTDAQSPIDVPVVSLKNTELTDQVLLLTPCEPFMTSPIFPNTHQYFAYVTNMAQTDDYLYVGMYTGFSVGWQLIKYKKEGLEEVWRTYRCRADGDPRERLSDIRFNDDGTLTIMAEHITSDPTNIFPAEPVVYTVDDDSGEVLGRINKSWRDGGLIRVNYEPMIELNQRDEYLWIDQSTYTYRSSLALFLLDDSLNITQDTFYLPIPEEYQPYQQVSKVFSKFLQSDDDNNMYIISTMYYTDRTGNETFLTKFDSDFNLIWQERISDDMYRGKFYNFVWDNDKLLIIGTSRYVESDGYEVMVAGWYDTDGNQLKRVTSERHKKFTGIFGVNKISGSDDFIISSGDDRPISSTWSTLNYDTGFDPVIRPEETRDWLPFDTWSSIADEEYYYSAIRLRPDTTVNGEFVQDYLGFGYIIKVPISEFGITVSTDELVRNSTYQVYPNPTTYTWHLDLDQGWVTDYTLVDILGRVMDQGMNIKETNLQLDSQRLDSGYYLLTFTTNTGRQETVKLLKQ